MQCGCIKNTYNAYLGSNGCKELIYEDESVWMQEDGYTIPDTYIVTITTPSNAKVDLELGVGRRNRITSADLFLRKILNVYRMVFIVLLRKVVV